MVAIFTGAGTGLERGSGSVLGSVGLLGASALGRAGEQLFLNAATGNFLLSRRDEYLVGRGPDAAVARTYNSLGDLSDENGDNWRQSTDRRIRSFVPNTSVKRVSGDGSEITYAFNGSVYTTTEGSGPHDKLAYDVGTNSWLWTDGGTQITEKYIVSGGEWVIQDQTDPAGNKIMFYYDNGKLISVVTADGHGTITYNWSGNNITQMVTTYTDLATSTAKTLTRTRYSYDAYNRLSTVTVDLTPGDNSVADNVTYTSSYTYYGASKLVHTISQTDGSLVELGYDGSNRLTSVTQTAADGVTRLTTIAYNAGSTAITDPTGQVVTLEYDAATQALKKIIAPPAYAGAAPQTAQFSYSPTTGDVLSVTDAAGNVTSHSYDPQGNAISTTDRLGNVITRTYGSRNELLTETRPGSSGASNATTLTTRYAYDAQLNLRFVVTPEGRVTQYLNDAYGQPYYRIVYTKDRYDVSALAASTPLTETQLANWHAGLADKSAIHYDYTHHDQRGNIAQKVDYGGTDSAGNPITADGYTHEYFTYDQAGQLLNRTTATLNTETFVYDGLGRLTASVDLNGGSTSFLFQDAQRQTVVTLANGFVETHSYNRAGELIASTKSGDFVVAGSATQHKYDKNGRLRMSTDATGNDRYYLYDKAGRKIADINEAGWIAEYRYDSNDRVIATTHYTNALSAGQLATLADPNSTVEMSTIRPAAHAQDIWAWYVYDKEGRILETIGGDGAATVHAYDQSGRHVKSTTYSYKFTAAIIAGFKTTPPTAITYPQMLVSKDIVARTFYDKDGRIIGALDSIGFLSEISYDEAGRKVAEVRYYNVTVEFYRGTGTFAQLKAGVAAHASDRRTRYVYDAQDNLRFTIDALNQVTGYGYESESTYSAYGAVRQTVRYAGTIGALSSYTYASVKAAIAAAGLTNHVDNRISYSVYDTADRLAYSIDAAGGAIGYTYDAEGHVTRIVRYAALPGFTSLPTKAQMDSWAAGQAGNGANRITRQFYSDRGELRFSVDGEGYVTRFDYDAEGRTLREVRWTNPISVTDSTSIYSVNDLANASGTWVDKNFAYDATGKLVWSYDGEGNNRAFVYYANGTLAWDIAMSGTADQSRTLYVYDGSGRLTERHDAYDTIDAVTRYDYDGQGNIVTVTDPRGNSTYIYYNKMGLEVGRRDAEDHVTETGYNFFHEVAWTRRRYSKATNAASWTVYPSYTANGGDSTTTYQYDKLGRVSQTNDALNYFTTNTYNVFGDLVTVQRGAAIYGYEAITGFEYDKAGRLKKTTDAETHYEQYGLNAFGEKETVRNKIGGVTVNTYDRRGLLVTETLPMASVDDQGNILATTVLNKFEYDARGNLSKKIEAFGLPEQRTTSYFYDKADRLIESRGDSVYATDQTNYQTQTLVAPSEKLKYDGRGNVVERIDALNARTLIYYDQLNRVSVEIDPLGTYTSYTYDKNGNRLTDRVHATPVAQPATAGGAPPSPPAGEYRETSFTYDKLNRLKTRYMTGLRTGAWNGSAYATSVGTVTFASYDYDARDNVIKTIDGNGNTVLSWFDKLNRKWGEADQEGYYTAWINDHEGNVLSERRYAIRPAALPGSQWWTQPATHADDRVTLFTYDKNGRRLTEQRTGVVAHSIDPQTGEPVLAASAATVYYSYNGLGQVTRKTEATGDYTDYVYDNAGRLEQEIRSPYANQDNVTVRPTVRYSYDGLNNLTVTRQGEQTVAAGDRFTRYTYGAGGRLATMTSADLSVQNHFYDAAGNIVRTSYNRVRADAPSVTEGILYTRDLLGRTLSQAVGTWDGSAWVKGDVQSTAYNAYGDLAQRGMNGLWQEQFAYDAAGRLTGSNSGDGIWRYFVYDGAGRQTLVLESEGTDLANLTVDQALAVATANGAHAVGGAYIDGINATIGVLDKRGQQTSTRLPFRQLDASALQTITTSRTYNAFGDVVTETDPRANVTDFVYNTMGRMIEKKSPTVSYTGEDGVAASARPIETYYYDVSGRMIGVRNANGYRNTRLLLAGTGYGGSEALATAEHHADGGVFRTYYDVFGDARILRNELGDDEFRAYDAMGRMTQQTHRGGLLTDNYAYDLLGQRISHSNNINLIPVYGPPEEVWVEDPPYWDPYYGWIYPGTGHYETQTPIIGYTPEQEVTEYDLQGRVTRTVAFGGDTTTTSYVWSSLLTTAGMGTFGGWTETTTYANNRTSVDKSDIFGRQLSHTDMGANVVDFGYDRAGRLTSRSGGEALVYNWLNTGLINSISSSTGNVASNNWSSRTTTYGYDAAGHVTSEQTVDAGEEYYTFYWAPGEPDIYYNSWSNVTQSGTAQYDAVGRMTNWTESGSAISPAASNAWEYDLVGNIRKSTASYRTLDAQGNASAVATTVEQWYRYDVMNRVVTERGFLSGGQILRGAGVDYTYNAAGQRMSATGTSAETYTYNDDGTLSEVWIAGQLRSTQVHDALGRLTRQSDWIGNGVNAAYDRQVYYNAKGQISSETVATKQSNGSGGWDTYTSYVGNTFGEGASYALGAVLTITSSNWKNGYDYGPNGAKDTFTSNSYVWFDGAVTSQTSFDSESGNANNPLWTTTYAYNGSGALTSAQINDGRSRTVTYTNDVTGQTLRRDESDNNYSNGDPHEVWYRFGGKQVGYVGNNGTLDTDYATSIANRQKAQGAGAFRFGSTTASSHADFDLGVESITSYAQGAGGGSYKVNAGDSLATIAARLWGDSGLWYKLAEANGLSAGSALIEGQSLIVPAGVVRSTHNASTFRPYDPAETLGETSPTTPKPNRRSNKCGVFGAVLLVAIAVAVSVITSGAFLAATGLVQGGLGAGIATTLGLAGAASAPLGGMIAAGAIGGAVGSIVSQGVGVATGLQDKFSWKGVALAGLSGGIGAGVGAMMPAAQGTFQAAARGFASGLTSSFLTQSIATMTGLQSKFDWAGVAAAAFGGAASGAVGANLGGLNRHLAGAISSTAGAIASAAARSLVNGSDFGDNLLAALPDVIGSTLGNMFAEGVAGIGSRAASAPGRTDDEAPDFGLRQIGDGQYELPLSDGTVLTGSLTEIDAGLRLHLRQLQEAGQAPSWVNPVGGAAAPEGGFFQEGAAILRYQEGGTGLLWQDIHRNVIYGADAAGVLGEWTAHFGANRTAGHLATELGGYNEYILSMAQYATVGAFLRPDHAGSLLSLAGMLMTYYQPDVVVTGSRPTASASGRNDRPTMRALLDSNYRVAHLNPSGGDGETGAQIGLMVLEYGEGRRNGMSPTEAVLAIGTAMAAALRRRGRGGPQPVPRTGPHGVDPNHHNANVMVRDSNGRVISHERVVSGNMTVEEQALGFPRNTLASHTEARAVRNTRLRPGDVMTITGQNPPCPSCKGSMNATAAETGATIRYRWRQNGRTVTWEARPGGR